MMQRDLDVEAKMAQFAFQRLQTQNYQRLQEDVTDIKKKLDVRRTPRLFSS